MEDQIDDEENEFFDISRRDCIRAVQAAEKDGYKDGSYDGSQSVFQQGFDDGFAIGNRSGHQLGRYQGMLAALEHLKIAHTTSTGIDLLLTNSQRGQCQVCVNKELIKKDVKALCDLQEAHTLRCSQQLATKYNHLDMYLQSNSIKETPS